MLTRRRFLGYSALSSAMLASRPLLRSGLGQAAGAAGRPVRLAVIGSTYTLGSNLQSILDRFLVGYPFDGDWHMPSVQVVSVYVDNLQPKFGGPMAFERPGANRIAQSAIATLVRANGEPASDQPALADQGGRRATALAMPASMPQHPPVGQNVHGNNRRGGGGRNFFLPVPGDLSESRSKEFGFRLCRNIPEALRAGGESLAVDAVLVVAEQAGYAVNDRGQALLPRYDFFQQCAQVFKEEGRGLPYFNYKQLSFSFPEAQEMVQTANRMRFPLMAGSAVPVTWRLPGVDIPAGAQVQEAVMVGVGSLDDEAFDALDAMQSMLERRKGGETGVKAVQLLEGDAVWEAGNSGRYSKDLLSSALSRSDTPLGLTLIDGRTQDLVASGALPQLVKNPAAFCLEYNDGTRATMLMLNGAVMDFNISTRVAGQGMVSTQFLRPATPNLDMTACLAAKLEQLFAGRQASHPVERDLLTTGILEAGLNSRHQLNQRLETPHLAVRYQAPADSQYIRT